MIFFDELARRLEEAQQKIVAQQERIRKLRQVDFCPDCDNTGAYYVRTVSGEGEPVQCRWCYDNPRSLFNLLGVEDDFSALAAHDAEVAAEAIGRCWVAVRGLTGLIHKAQERLTKYLVPDSDGDAHACISDVLDLLDGPEWREAERKAILATAPAISPPFTDPNASIAAEVLGHAIGRLSSDSYFVGAEEAIRIVEELAAEYRAKAGRKE